MKKKFLTLLVGSLLGFSVSAANGDFTISSVGSSNGTNTIFIETIEAATATTNCSNRKLFRLPDSDKSADRLFSLALSAQAQNKKITLDYNIDECLEGGVLISVFRLKG